MEEGYSHELSSCGFWPGGGEEGAFYVYAYPEPDGFADWPVGPAGAFYSKENGQFLLPYEAVRAAPDPDAAARTGPRSRTTPPGGTTVADSGRELLEHDGVLMTSLVATEGGGACLPGACIRPGGLRGLVSDTEGWTPPPRSASSCCFSRPGSGFPAAAGWGVALDRVRRGSPGGACHGVGLGLVLVSGGDVRVGVFTGFLNALSSTAIVLKINASTGASRDRVALAVRISRTSPWPPWGGPCPTSGRTKGSFGRRPPE